jgi:ribosomal protein S18 acetylase RimI-like enzyme
MKIEILSRDHKPQVVSVLSAAFHDYPVMRFVLKSTGANYEKDLNALVAFFCEVRLTRNWPVLGIRAENGSLVAAALVNDLLLNPLPLPEQPLQQLKETIGDEAYQRLVAYELQSSIGEPKVLHHFLGMIGVHPYYQKKGYADALMNFIKEFAMKNPESNGVCLSTEIPWNVRFYEHHGYRVISEADVGELHSWCMFLQLK